MKKTERCLWAAALLVWLVAALVASVVCYTVRMENKTLREWQSRPLIIVEKEN
jgi:hypothetical protein